MTDEVKTKTGGEEALKAAGIDPNTGMQDGAVNQAQPKAAPAPEQQAPQGPDLTIQDLQSLKAIIDVASQRGAYKPNEMVVVGQTYNKLQSFLEAVAKTQQPAQQGGQNG
jgi:hypothetical protein